MAQQSKAIHATASDPSKCESLDQLQITSVDVHEPGEGEVVVRIKLRPVNLTDIAKVRGISAALRCMLWQAAR